MMRFEVFVADRRMGWLEHNSVANLFSFAYSPDWLSFKDAFALAPNLPLIPIEQTAETHSRAVRLFFENLLPEGKALDDVAATYAISKHNVSALLVHLGKETAGALRIVLPAQEEIGTKEVKRYISRKELSERIRDRNTQPFSVWDRKVRLSIAGYQDKIAVLQDNNDVWFLVEGQNLASTHLIKPEPTNPLLAGLTSNEFFCMRLAKAVKLPVAEVVLHHVPEPVLAIKRFDRRIDGERVVRLPVIDGCQALGISPSAKYERPYGDTRDVQHIRDGACYRMLFELLSNTSRPAAERLALLRWAIFQVLIGNTDAHAKNLTFMAGSEGLSLAPAYDLLCGLIYAGDRIEDSYAMAIGDAFSPSALTAYEWAQFTVATQQPVGLVQTQITMLSTQVIKMIDAVKKAAIYEGAEEHVVSAVAVKIEAEAKRHLQIAPEIHHLIHLAK